MGKGGVMVTGGAGFIGAHVCRKLLDGLGHPVICLDNLATGSMDNLADLLANPDFTFIEHDITHPIPEDVPKCLYILNLACPGSPVFLQRDKEQSILTSVLGLRNVLRYAIFSRSETVFQASTGAVYGDPEVTPQRESYPGRVNPIGPLACYEEGKRAAEALCLAYREQCGIRVKIGRLFNTYGPGMHLNAGTVVANFLTQALQGQPLTVYGDGRQTRTFCYIDDMVDGILRLAMDTPGEFTGPLNLGSDIEVSIRELAEIVLEVTAAKSEIRTMPPPASMARLRRPEIGLAKQILGWEPTTGLQEGLEKTAAYFRSLLETPIDI